MQVIGERHEGRLPRRLATAEAPLRALLQPGLERLLGRKVARQVDVVAGDRAGFLEPRDRPAGPLADNQAERVVFGRDAVQRSAEPGHIQRAAQADGPDAVVQRGSLVEPLVHPDQLLRPGERDRDGSGGRRARGDRSVQPDAHDRRVRVLGLAAPAGRA